MAAQPVHAKPPAQADATVSLSAIFAGQPAAPAEAEAPTVGTIDQPSSSEAIALSRPTGSGRPADAPNSETQDTVAIKQCLTDLASANVQYLEQHSQASDRSRFTRSSPSQAPIHRRLDQALGEQAEQVSISNRELADVDLESDLLVGCRKLLDETSRLVDANHTMREALDDAELQLGRDERRRSRQCARRAAAQPSQPGATLGAALADCWDAESEPHPPAGGRSGRPGPLPRAERHPGPERRRSGAAGRRPVGRQQRGERRPRPAWSIRNS